MSPEDVWGRSGPGGGESKWKGPEVGEQWVFLRENKETSLAETAPGNTGTSCEGQHATRYLLY